ncbi:MAG TPA: DsbE family thiol:disulfide interchange protein [Caulobacteraceae bacterium]|jgi:cytochrome c biogenesis protein CcmG/thiol:disulfide interchange protein DsbE|nr:DsbE family thiol:disulfide interchange protein [Caulobacteraceae bacterium]
MRRLVFLAPVVVFAGVMVAFALGLGHDPSVLPSTLIGKPVPAFSLPPVRPGDGGLASPQLASGGGPRLLNAFASWCVACRVEHPLLLGLKAQGVPIDGLDWKDKSADAEKYLTQQGDPYQRVGNDESGRAGIDLGVAGVPETFVVDGHGRVRYKQVGPITPDDWTRTIQPLMERLRRE